VVKPLSTATINAVASQSGIKPIRSRSLLISTTPRR
jgi:hypothetical protein